jgi:hypothetical protein
MWRSKKFLPLTSQFFTSNFCCSVCSLENVADLEGSITNCDMTILFMSKDYFSSWNCLREVRHAALLHCAGLGDEQEGGYKAGERQARADVIDRRSKLEQYALGGSSMILMRETDEQNHGGVPKQKLLDQCPEYIGCGEHVFKLDGACEQCGECSINIRATLRAHADGAGGVIDWVRFKVFCQHRSPALTRLHYVMYRISRSSASSRSCNSCC